MGQSSYHEHKLYLEILQRILKERGFKTPSFKLAALLVWLNSNSNVFPPHGSYTEVWEKVVAELEAQKKQGRPVTDDMSVTWKTVYTALKALQPAEKVREHPVTGILNLETDLNVSHVEVPAELGDEDPQGAWLSF